MKNTKVRVALAALLAAGAMLAAQSLPANLKIDFKYNLGKDEVTSGKDFFNWTGEKAVKDHFSPSATRDHDGALQTGASVNASTEHFNAISVDAAGKRTIPRTLKAFLYAVSDRKTFENDNFEVVGSGPYEIRFVHNGTAFYIKTDAKGVIRPEDAKSLTVCDSQAGVRVIKPEFLKEGGDNKKMADVDWAKVTPQLASDAADGAKKYAGTLNAAYKNGVLTVKGTLKLQ